MHFVLVSIQIAPIQFNAFVSVIKGEYCQYTLITHNSKTT